MTVTEQLLAERDESNADFQAKLAPTLSHDNFLGVKVPMLRTIEKSFRNTPEKEDFLKSLPHNYYDENLIHSIFISNEKDFSKALMLVEAFLPYVDNWAVCDTLRPKAFAKQDDGFVEKIKEWISSNKTYTCRFGIDMLMTYYLDEKYKPEYLALPASVNSDEYYVNMMIAWYYATALAKRWDDTIPYITERKLSPWVHNKTIQKAVESYRISDDRKTYLKTLRIRSK